MGVAQTENRADRSASNGTSSGPKLLDRLRAEIRVRHYSIRTEHAYADWVKRYVHERVR